MRDVSGICAMSVFNYNWTSEDEEGKGVTKMRVVSATETR